jgi:hypothetical protein
MKSGKCIIVLCLFFLTACSTLEEDTSSLIGLWKEEMCNMGFKIENNQLTEYDDVSTREIAFAGDIVNNPDLTAAKGLIIIKITVSGTKGAAIGYYAVSRWKNFTGKQVGQTFSRDNSNNALFFSTLAEAQALTESSTELSFFCCDISIRQ